MPRHAPQHLDVKKTEGLTVTWPDGTTTFYSVAHLRKFSPSAEMREMREEQQRNPLNVLPSSMADATSENLTITDAELVGNYAIRFDFSDGHHTGIYSWEYLRDISPD